MIKRMLLIASICLGGCTMLPPAPFPDISMCPEGDMECILEAMDADRFEVAKAGGVQQIKFMEGYEPSSLVELKEMDRLTIEKLEPYWVALGIFGYAHMVNGETGDMARCDMAYSTQGSLLHELRHCQGFWERKPYLWVPNTSLMYTERQREIMEEEGVSRWIDTEYYKDEDTEYHWILGD